MLDKVISLWAWEGGRAGGAGAVMNLEKWTEGKLWKVLVLMGFFLQQEAGSQEVP